MTKPVIYGPPRSAYVRTVRLVMAEKKLDYDLVDVDIARGDQHRPEHLERHPFGKVPAFAHDGLRLYETSAITRYLDATFPEVPLTPSEPRQIGLMQQAIAVTDAYAYPAMITAVVIQRLVVPREGGTPDERAVESALPQVERCLDAFDAMLEQGFWLSGGDLGLADLHLAPIIHYLSLTPEGRRLLPRHGRLQRWWGGMTGRESMALTDPTAR
jgi:glutathione S-transferase